MLARSKIDIIIPIYKNAELTRKCIDSVVLNLLEIQDFSPRLLLANDSPDDAAVTTLLEKVQASVPNVLVFRNVKNLGFVKNVNQCLDVSIRDRRDVILINSDTETFTGTLSNLLAVAYADPQIAFVSPRSNNAALCSLPHFFGGVVPTAAEAYRRWSAISPLLPQFHFAPTAVGFYMFISHKVLANFGGLREDFGLGYEEENDLIMRANKAGYRAALANWSFAFHVGSASFNLRDLDLKAHRRDNLKKISIDHPEFLPLVRRYEATPHFRAERMLTPLVGRHEDKLKIAFELSGLGTHYNGTAEQAIGILHGFSRNAHHDVELSVICSEAVFKFHGMHGLGNVSRADVSNPGRYAIAIRQSQPFDQHHINVLENLAPNNIYGMLDTIAEDCGHLSLSHRLSDHWEHVAKHANGLFFNSKVSEKTFCTRYPNANVLPKYTRLLPTKLSSYAVSRSSSGRDHVLILGNHFPHKGAAAAATILSASFPSVQFVVLGSDDFESGNLRGYRSGLLAQGLVNNLFSRASIVVLPSHAEGFGFGLLHALAARKPVVARKIDATMEILSTLRNVHGVFLYDDDGELANTLSTAMASSESRVDDDAAIDWEEWAAGLIKFCKELLVREDVFVKLRDRIYASDLLRKSQLASTPPSQIHDLESLLQLEGREFVEHAYLTLLGREADPEGLQHYLAQRSSSVPKLQIVEDILASPESKRAPLRLAPLQEAFKKSKKKRSRSFYVLFRQFVKKRARKF